MSEYTIVGTTNLTYAVMDRQATPCIVYESFRFDDCRDFVIARGGVVNLETVIKEYGRLNVRLSKDVLSAISGFNSFRNAAGESGWGSMAEDIWNNAFMITLQKAQYKYMDSTGRTKTVKIRIEGALA